MYVPAFHLARFSRAMSVRLLPKLVTAVLHRARHEDRLAASTSKCLRLTPTAFSDDFKESLYCMSCPPRLRAPNASSEYKTCFGRRVSDMWAMRPDHLSRAVISSASMPSILQISRISVSGNFSCHFTGAINRRERIWN
jgi:hypothetical protein